MMELNDREWRFVVEALVSRIEVFEKRLASDELGEDEFWEVGQDVACLRELAERFQAEAPLLENVEESDEANRLANS